MRFAPREKLASNLLSAQRNSVEEQRPPTISIVIPAYYEEGNLFKLYEELLQILTPMSVPWELIIVDDGSTDGTWRELSVLHQQDARVKGLQLSRNFGHQYALSAGLSNATGQAIITMDADLQHPPAVIPQLIAQWNKGSKIVHTVRIDHQNVPWLKKITSRVFYKIFSFLSGVELSAGMADFRLLDRQVADELIQLKESGLFLRGLVQWIGYPSSKVEFQCSQRFSGQSKYTFLKMLKLAWIGVTSFSLIPLRLGTILGLITSLIAFYQLVYAIWAKLFTDTIVPGWATIVAIISLLFGVVFIQLGIVGEYIGRILTEVRGRPRFLISDRLGFPCSAMNLQTFNSFTSKSNDECEPSFSPESKYGDL